MTGTRNEGIFDAHRLVTAHMQRQYVAMQNSHYGSPEYERANAAFEALNALATQLMGMTQK